jgi:hypothetical protein
MRGVAGLLSPVSIAKVYDGIAAMAQPGGKNAALEENKVQVCFHQAS